MDANQLAEGVARAVEAAKPAQEYCFLWIDHWSMCMTKAEWSGWMQAVGSIVALIVAIYVPQKQRVDQKKENAALAVSAAAFQVAILRAVQKQLEPKGLEVTMAGMKTSLKSLRAMIAAINPMLISSDGMPVYAGLLNLSHEIEELTVEADANRVDGEGFTKRIEALLDAAHSLLKLTEARIEGATSAGPTR